MIEIINKDDLLPISLGQTKMDQSKSARVGLKVGGICTLDVEDWVSMHNQT